MDFLGSEENRYSYALAYGAMAVSVTNLFLGTLGDKQGAVVKLEGSPWLSGKIPNMLVLCTTDQKPRRYHTVKDFRMW